MGKLMFFSSDWFAAAAQLLPGECHEAARPASTVRVNQVITGAPFGGGTLLAHISTSDGGARLGPGHVADPDATITLDYVVARALLLDGNPQAGMRAFMTGQLQVSGEMSALIAAQQQLRSLSDPVIAGRLRTITA